MAGSELTPEMLVQLEALLTGWEGSFSTSLVDNPLDGWEGQTQLVWRTSPTAGAAFEDETCLATDFNSDVAPDIAAMLNAIPALVAAVKERDQLQFYLDEARQERNALQQRALQLRDERDAAKTEVERLRAQLDNTTGLRQRDMEHASRVAAALGIDGWENGWPDLAPRIEMLRAEIDKQLRDAVAPILPISADVEDLVEGLMQEARRAEIERKP